MSGKSGVDQLEFLQSASNAFGSLGPEGDFIHGTSESDHPSVTETYWFEVLVPKSKLVAHFYIFMRPNLKMCHAGVFMHRGFCNNQLQMDHFNYHIALPFPTADGNKVMVPQIGLTITIEKPLDTLHISYHPPGFDDTWAEITASAVMPPMVRATNKHINQFMHYTGEISLNGDNIPVDDISIRDRSWGEPRPEDPLKAPITSWASGYFPTTKTAFNFIGFDDPERGAEWKGVYDIPSEKTLMDGWYYADGRFLKMVGMSKKSDRNPASKMEPSRVEAELTDSEGGKHHLVGRPIAALAMSPWATIHTWEPLMEWELDGAKGYGDCQEYSWPDYIKRFWR